MRLNKKVTITNVFEEPSYEMTVVSASSNKMRYGNTFEYVIGVRFAGRKERFTEYRWGIGGANPELRKFMMENKALTVKCVQRHALSTGTHPSWDESVESVDEHMSPRGLKRAFMAKPVEEAVKTIAMEHYWPDIQEFLFCLYQDWAMWKQDAWFDLKTFAEANGGIGETMAEMIERHERYARELRNISKQFSLHFDKMEDKGVSEKEQVLVKIEDIEEQKQP